MMKLIGALCDYAYVPNTHHSRIKNMNHIYIPKYYFNMLF